MVLPIMPPPITTMFLGSGTGIDRQWSENGFDVSLSMRWEVTAELGHGNLEN